MYSLCCLVLRNLILSLGWFKFKIVGISIQLIALFPSSISCMYRDSSPSKITITFFFRKFWTPKRDIRVFFDRWSTATSATAETWGAYQFDPWEYDRNESGGNRIVTSWWSDRVKSKSFWNVHLQKLDDLFPEWQSMFLCSSTCHIWTNRVQTQKAYLQEISSRCWRFPFDEYRFLVTLCRFLGGFLPFLLIHWCSGRFLETTQERKKDRNEIWMKNNNPGIPVSDNKIHRKQQRNCLRIPEIIFENQRMFRMIAVTIPELIQTAGN